MSPFPESVLNENLSADGDDMISLKAGSVVFQRW
jgi:hypothetical protein